MAAALLAAGRLSGRLKQTEEVWLKASPMEICPCSPSVTRPRSFLLVIQDVGAAMATASTVGDLHGFVMRNNKRKEVFVKTTC